jgi:GntR family transcriptional regulator
MFIRIERGSSAPISRQIAEQIRSQCLSGILKPGRCLPSVRQLASELGVNVNTIVRVYERLTAEGLLEMRHGEGTFVLPAAKTSIATAELNQQREQFCREFEAIVRRGLLLGFSTVELRSMLSASASEAKTMIIKESKTEKKNLD